MNSKQERFLITFAIVSLVLSLIAFNQKQQEQQEVFTILVDGKPLRCVNVGVNNISCDWESYNDNSN